jgi:hypothetical protein
MCKAIHYSTVCNNKEWKDSPALMAHAYNPSYSGGRDQEDCGSKPAWANKLWDPISKNPTQKKGLVEWFKV